MEIAFSMERRYLGPGEDVVSAGEVRKSPWTMIWRRFRHFTISCMRIVCMSTIPVRLHLNYSHLWASCDAFFFVYYREEMRCSSCWRVVLKCSCRWLGPGRGWWSEWHTWTRYSWTLFLPHLIFRVDPILRRESVKNWLNYHSLCIVMRIYLNIRANTSEKLRCWNQGTCGVRPSVLWLSVSCAVFPLQRLTSSPLGK